MGRRVGAKAASECQKNIHGAEFMFCTHPHSLNGDEVKTVGGNPDRPPAGLIDLAHEVLDTELLAAVDYDRGPLFRQHSARCGANSLRAPGNDSHLAGKIRVRCR